MNKTPFYLIDDVFARSSWDFDVRGADRVPPENVWERKELAGTANGYPCVAKRDVNVQNEGVFTFETIYAINDGNGLYFEFSDGEQELFKIKQQNGFYYAADKKLLPIEYGIHHIKIVLDLDNRSANVISDGKDLAECDFTGSANALASFRAGYDADSVGSAYIDGRVKLYTNYLFNDGCIFNKECDLPLDYKVDAPSKTSAVCEKYSDFRNVYAYSLKSQDLKKCSAAISFEKTKGEVCFELRYYPAQNSNGKQVFTLKNKDEDVLTFWDCGTELCCNRGVVKKHSLGVWQMLRIVADTTKQKAHVYLNGKNVSETAFDLRADGFDGFCVSFESDKADVARFSDIRIFEMPKEPEDYVPEPVIPQKKGDYAVGMLTCSLWREGSHYGWDCITPFADDHKPLLGWYDEGFAETADWEIKWMCEHGVDYQLYCWYPTDSDRAFKQTRMSFATYEGHMYAKYSDKLKMAIIWEAANSPAPASSEDFRKYYVPHMIDYFFSDPRYMTVDNKPILSVFGPQKLINAFGGEKGLKAEFDYLRQEVKKLGFDDLIILCCGTSNTQQNKDSGFDGVHAYTWGTQGYDIDYTKSRINEEINAGFIETVPTISQGYNLVGWTGYRTPSTTPEDFKTMLEWCCDDILSKRDPDSWKSKLVVLATWNEYGEGTYICPSNLYGLGYLDAVRSVFTSNPPHTDVYPTKEQCARVNKLYVQDRALIAPLDKVPYDDEGNGVYKRYEFKTQEDLDKWEFHGFSSLEIKDGRLFGHSEQFDPYMILKDDEFLPFPASKVQKIRAHIRTYKPVNQMCCIQIGYSNSPDGQIGARRAGALTDPDKIAELDIQVRRIRGWPWRGSVTAFRFDPVYAVGDFELVDIEFVRSKTEYILKIDGKEITLAQDVYLENGEYYIPFDTTSLLKCTRGMYYEWHNSEQQLVIKGVKDYVFTKDSTQVKCGDKVITLAKPFSFYDGIPALPASLFAEIIGRTLVVDDDVVELKQREK